MLKSTAIREVFPASSTTICENALIGGYARQLKSITPDIIGEVATDLRLNLVRTPRAPEIVRNDNDELWQAVKTLLQTHESAAMACDHEIQNH